MHNRSLLDRPRSFLGLALISSAVGTMPSAAMQRSVRDDPSGGSVRFIENLGQWPAGVQFAADVGGVTVRAECSALGFHTISDEGRGHYVRLAFLGSSSAAHPRGIGAMLGAHNYYLGNDPLHWQRNARAFCRIEYDDLYPGIDMVLHAENGRPKYDLVLAAGVDPSTVRVKWLGADDVHASSEGVGLLLGSAVMQEMPAVAWQPREDGSTRASHCFWERGLEGDLVLRALDLDPGLPLVVDPELIWSTYLGSSSGEDHPVKVAVDSDGNVHVLGYTNAFDFPVTPGAFHFQVGAWEWVTVTKFRSLDGQAVFSSVFGGSSNYNRPSDLSVDPSGRSVVIGNTRSHDFPLTAGSYDPFFTTEEGGFVVRLSAIGGQVEFSTILEPASGLARVFACASKSDGSTVVAGGFSGNQFPSTLPMFGFPPSGFPGAAFVLELDPTGSAITWSRHIGSEAGIYDLALSPDGTLTLAGATYSEGFPTTPGVFQPTMGTFVRQNIFLTRFSANAQDLIWSTYLGGTNPNEQDYVFGMSLDAFGAVTLSIQTNATTFPTTPGSIQPEPPSSSNFLTAVLCRISNDASQLIYSTFTTTESWGGLGYPVVDASGVVTLLGFNQSLYPATPGAYDEVYGPGQQFQILRIDPYGQRILHLTHVGGSGYNVIQEIAASSSTGRVSVIGEVQSPGNYPTTPGCFQPNFAGGGSDMFVTTMNLDVAGVTQLGPGTPACHGPIRVAALRKPSPGAQGFGLYCSGAPQNARGALLLGRPSASPSVFGGATIYVDRSQGWRLLRARTDEFGFVESSLPIPGLIPGETYAAQYVFINQQECQGSGRLSSSPGLRLVIQQP